MACFFCQIFPKKPFFSLNTDFSTIEGKEEYRTRNKECRCLPAKREVKVGDSELPEEMFPAAGRNNQCSIFNYEVATKFIN